MSDHIFISHSTEDNDFATELRLALEALQLSAWVDTRELSGGQKLRPELATKIEEARHVIVIVSLNALNSAWVQWEVERAREVEARRTGDGYKVIPLMFPNIKPAALKLLFGEEPLGVKVELKSIGVNEALPQILAALGERLPDGLQPASAPPAIPVEELILKLSRPQLDLTDGKRRAMAEAQLVYEPADKTARNVESDLFPFTSPLGPIEADELRWYLEEFYRWPSKTFQTRAKLIEKQLPEWGRLLFDEAVKDESAKETLDAWKGAASGAERRFSVMVDERLIKGSSEEQQTAAREAASLLLSLPWELLDDGRGFLFQGNHQVRVRRRLPNRHLQEVRPSALPIRILLVSPRPEDARTGYIDHRISAKPLFEAVAELGALATVTLLTPPTFPALQQELTRASKSGQSYDVVHFDGHGIYDARVGLGQLCFEDPKDADLLDERAMQPIDAARLAAEMRAHRIPLVFLEAYQSAKSDDDPTTSVAAKLLEEGVTSVVAMTHSVLVETARRFVEAFYQELARGSRVGTAMLAGQHALFGDTHRGKVAGAGDLNLQDWFVPVLFQEANDPRLLTQLPSETSRQLQTERRRLSLGRLPLEPPHTFIGRSRELLRLERLLLPEASPELRYAVLRGVGGEGKTTLAAELARWMVAANRFHRAAFVSFDPNDPRGCGDARSLLDSLGQQLLPEGDRWSVAEHEWKEAVQQVERALRDHPTILVLDNLESVLPSGTGFSLSGQSQDSSTEQTEVCSTLFALCQTLLRAHPATRIVFTSRESLPAPFDHRQREIPLGQLSLEDAVELVSQVLRSQHRRLPEAEQPGGTAQAITDLVETANRHARALVRLTQELADRDLRSTTEDLRQALAALDRKHPGDRENSLYASVELSLRRLPPDLREQVKVLAVFHGGANVGVLAMMLENPQSVTNFTENLIAVGLATDAGYGYLQLDPALPSFMSREVNEDEQKTLRTRWAKTTQALVRALYEHIGQEMEVAANLVAMDLHNLLAMITWAEQWESTEQVVSLTGQIESFLANLGRPRALAQVIKVRERAARKLTEWSHTCFLTEATSVDRLLERGQLTSALAAAQQLWAKCQTIPKNAFPEATYDLASAQVLLGRVLRLIGKTEVALNHIGEARKQFECLATAGNVTAERMAAAALTEIGGCLRSLGQLDAATVIFQEAIRCAEKRGDRREIAVNEQQLGIVQMHQKQHDKALTAYSKAKTIFESLGESLSTASCCHQIAMVYRKIGKLEQAENFCRQALSIQVQQGDRKGESSSLGELGSVYAHMGKLEEALIFSRQAAEIYAQLQDQRYEGFARNNLADTLIKLHRYDEARPELLRAIECKKPFNHAAEPWKTWNTLHNLEQATGNVQAAAEARNQTVASYLAYRRAGGESQSNLARLFALTQQAIQQGTIADAERKLDGLARGEIPLWAKALVASLRAILGGDRDPALAADPNLDYCNAVELQLLLESLGAK